MSTSKRGSATSVVYVCAYMGTHVARVYAHLHTCTHMHRHKCGYTQGTHTIWKCAYFATTKEELVNGCSHSFILNREGRPGTKSILILDENIWDNWPNLALASFVSGLFSYEAQNIPLYLTNSEMDFVSLKVIVTIKGRYIDAWNFLLFTRTNDNSGVIFMNK